MGDPADDGRAREAPRGRTAPPLAASEAEPSRFWVELAAQHDQQLRLHGLDEVKRHQALRYFTWQWRLRGAHTSAQLRFLLAHTSVRTKIKAAVAPQRLSSSAWRGLPWGRADRWFYAFATRLLWNYAERFGDRAVLALGEPTLGNPPPVVDSGRLVSQDLANSALEVQAIRRALGGREPTSVLEVGPGYGRTAYALLGLFPTVRYTVIDIEPALTLTRWYLTSIYPGADVTFLHPDEATAARIGGVDLAVSISSLQDMTAEQIRAYLELFDDVTAGVVYLKQWRQWTNPVDGVVADFDAYPYPSRWQCLFKERAPVQVAFTHAAWSVGAR